MPNTQQHRGKGPEDERQFSEEWIPVLRSAVADVSYLLSSGYAEHSAAKFVGDRYQITARQRRAVLAAACSDHALNTRVKRLLHTSALDGKALAIDGYNLLITTEAALSGGCLFKGRDGCIRDLASVHGAYHSVDETYPAINLIGSTLQEFNVPAAVWYLDAPVSNSARLKAMIEEEASRAEWSWRVELTHSTDKVLAASEHPLITSDGWILDRAAAWTNITPALLERMKPRPRVINLGSR